MGKKSKATAKPGASRATNNHGGRGQPQSTAPSPQEAQAQLMVSKLTSALSGQDHTMSLLLVNILRIRGLAIKCNHGAGSSSVRLPSQVSEYTILFIQKMDHALNIRLPIGQPGIFNAELIWRDILESIPPESLPNFGDKNVCDLIVSCLTSLGTSYLLEDKEILSGKCIAGLLAQAVLFVESMHGQMTHYTTTGENNMGEDDVHYMNYMSKVKDIWQDMDREITKFYHRRNECSCVKEKYDQVKKQTQMSICQHCRQRRARSELKICTRCRITCYCNQECQRLDWPDHKVRCIQYRSGGLL
jgi:hypothetical protein